MDQRAVGLKYGFRSGLEERVAAQLDRLGVAYTYEQVTFSYIKPAQKSRYTPDFVLSNGLVIETKGRFLPADRKKHLNFKLQHPEVELRFVFTEPRAKINKGSTTTYADWCEKHGFKYAKGLIPLEWLEGLIPDQNE